MTSDNTMTWHIWNFTEEHKRLFFHYRMIFLIIHSILKFFGKFN